MVHVATQSRRKNYGRSVPVCVKHFISCSYRDLDFLTTHLDGITSEKYTEELAKKTENKGDCCILSIVEWGHARLEIEEHPEKFDDEENMDFVSEFTFCVSKVCLSSNHNIFMVAPSDRDAHNPILIHLKPSNMSWHEKHQYKPYEMKARRKETRKEKQKRERVLAMVRYWTTLGTTLGTTGMALEDGFIVMIINNKDMVHPRLLHRGHGDQRTDECRLP